MSNPVIQPPAPVSKGFHKLSCAISVETLLTISIATINFFE